MNLAEHISSAFAPVAEPHGLLVPTATLYPSNGNVIVYVTGGDRECVVSDRGDALRNARAHGVVVPNIDSWLSRSLRGSFLRHEGAEISSGAIPVGDVFAGIALVARGASEAVRYAIEHYKKPPEPIYERTERELQLRFGKLNVAHKRVIVGASNREYEFDFSAPIGAQTFVLDIVTPNPASINAKAIAHIDVGNLKDAAPIHAMVYDSDAEWNAADINLLKSAAQLLPMSNLQTGLERYASVH